MAADALGKRKERSAQIERRDATLPRRQNSAPNVEECDNKCEKQFVSLVSLVTRLYLIVEVFFYENVFLNPIIRVFFKLNEPLQRGSEFDRCNVAAMEKLYNYNSINTIKQLIPDAHYPSERF